MGKLTANIPDRLHDIVGNFLDALHKLGQPIAFVICDAEGMVYSKADPSIKDAARLRKNLNKEMMRVMESHCRWIQGEDDIESFKARGSL